MSRLALLAVRRAHSKQAPDSPVVEDAAGFLVRVEKPKQRPIVYVGQVKRDQISLADFWPEQLKPLRNGSK